MSAWARAARSIYIIPEPMELALVVFCSNFSCIRPDNPHFQKMHIHADFR